MAFVDYLVVGGCSLGKSTVSNRILGLTLKGTLTLNQMEFFETFAGLRSRSCTKSYQTLSNGITGTRITDVEGFVIGDIKKNLSTLYELVRFHWESDITFHRVLYFLPRDVCSESCVQELKLLRHFYGSDIFKCMVVIATSGEHSMEGPPFDVVAIKEYFYQAFSTACVDIAARCPPVEYLSLTVEPEEIIQKIKSAKVEEEGGLKVNDRHWRIKEMLRHMEAHEHRKKTHFGIIT